MYYIKRKIKRQRLAKVSDIVGLETKPVQGKNKIKVKKVTICDSNLANKFIKKQLNKKFSKLYKTLYDFLISEDDSESGVKACLGEIEKVKAAIFNKYKEHMKNKLYKEYLAKIVLTENEFRNKFMEREYYARIIKDSFKAVSPSYDEDLEKGRSR